MATGPAEVKARQVATVMAGTRKRAVIAHLVACQGPHQQITILHVGELPTGIQRAASADFKNVVAQRRCVPLPGFDHPLSMCPLRAVPAVGITMQVIRQFYQSEIYF